MTKEKRLQFYLQKWMPSIKKWANRYANQVSGVEDLISEGILALIEALKNYDKKRGGTHAYICCCVSTAIKTAAMNSAFAVSIPSGTLTVMKGMDQKKFKAVPLDENRVAKTVIDHTAQIIEITDIIDFFDYNGVAHRYLIDDLTYEEIAKETGMSIATISRIVNKVREQARQKILQ